MDPTDVYNELQRRTFATEEDCRRAWQEEADPMAVCVAVAHADALPEWLRNAVLVLLHDGLEPAGGHVLRKAWRARHSATVKLLRTESMADALRDGCTWQEAAERADVEARHVNPSVPLNGAAGVKQTYHRVVRDLKAHPYRYWSAPAGYFERVHEALEATIPILRVVTKPPRIRHQTRRS